ncbi:DNA-binding protein [Halobacteriovorax sp. RT-1-4]|uniref:DNA-binding protein n=1 Tax=unclassified Halobacteriovorax TaxID=2639665 RepID=UPI00399A9588
MAQSKVSIDSNSYFRLAQTIHPLLNVEFGEEKYCLYIIDGFEGEYYKSRRLKSKFYWAKSNEYEGNRDRRISRSKKQKKEIDNIFEHIWEASQNYEYEGGENSQIEDKLPPGPVDCDALAVAKVLNIPVVTDDEDMTMLGMEFDVKMWSTLKLLRVMRDCHHIQNSTVTSLVRYWKETNEMPWLFRTHVTEYFSELNLLNV